MDSPQLTPYRDGLQDSGEVAASEQTDFSGKPVTRGEFGCEVLREQS